MNNKQGNNWILSAALCLPVAVFFSAYLLNHSADLSPTGFIQYDNVSYIAFARQYLDADHFHLLYANPFSTGGNQIYFQPQTLFFAFLLTTGIPAGWILIPFALVCCFICFRILIALYDQLAPPGRYRTLHIWMLCWGGGLLAASGLVAHVYLQRPGPAYNDLFIVDPEGGWWGLNLGRSLIFSCEAYYHALFLGCILSLVKRKWLPGFFCMALLSMSHPFTGIELLGIVCFWVVVEYMVHKKEVPVWFVAATLLLLALHIYYYLFYLNRFPDHQSVSSQYALNWRLRFYRMLPAYCITGAFAVASIYIQSLKTFFRSGNNRLLACWFITAFALANHEIFMKPMQPIHFTRGYIWTSLFLIGIPALNRFTVYIRQKWGIAAIILFSLMFFSDNLSWIIKNAARRENAESFTAFTDYLRKEEKEVFRVINEESSDSTLLICYNPDIAYLGSVYSKASPWYSHPFTTPYAFEKRNALENFLADGVMDASWMNRDVIFVMESGRYPEAERALSLFSWKKISQVNQYLIFSGSMHQLP